MELSIGRFHDGNNIPQKNNTSAGGQCPAEGDGRGEGERWEHIYRGLHPRLRSRALTGLRNVKRHAKCQSGIKPNDRFGFIDTIA